MLITRGDYIDASGVNAAVTEDISELGDVFFQLIKRPRKQMAKIMRKYLIGINVSLLA